MNRQLRFENAYNAVAQALLSGRVFTEASLLEIATTELGPRAAFLAKDALNRCILTSAGEIGPDIAISSDDDCETFSFQYIGG